MFRPKFLTFLLISLVLGSCSGGADRPNVLFIAVDDLNHWVTHLGRNPQAKTPNIDRLARLGVSFRHAYTAAPACQSSRTALMSGRRPWTTGCYNNNIDWKLCQEPGEGLSAQFLKAGYDVIGAGKIYHSLTYHESEWHDYMPPRDEPHNGPGVRKNHGFHEPLHIDLEDDDLYDWHAIDFCIQQLNRPRDRPFFIACGLFKPHLPLAVPQKYYEMFPLDSIQLPPYRDDDLEDIPPTGILMAKPMTDHARLLKNGRWKAAIQSYLAASAYTDMNIGRLLDALEASPQRDKTIVVLWSDHGWALGEKQHWRKSALWEEPTRVPLIWIAPGVTRPGGTSDRTVDLMSVYPTLCDLAEIPIPEHVEGPSIVQLLKNPKSEWERPAISTHGYKNHAIRTEDWRYIRYSNGDEELYDIKADPFEWTNLADRSQSTAVKLALADWLPDQDALPVEATAE